MKTDNSHKYVILTINPGSTSTKIALFQNEKKILSENIHHSEKELTEYYQIADQYPFRMRAIEDFLTDNGIHPQSLSAIVGRGGLLHPVEGGTYRVNEKMVQDLTEQIRGEHASNLGGLIAYALAEKLGIPAFIVDPVVVDEMEDIARLSGSPVLPRKSIFHALNQKAVARKAAAELGRSYFDINCIVVHLGGGITIGAHKKGRVIDVNNGLDGEGPYTSERSGTLPTGDLARYCFANVHREFKVLRQIRGKGGIVAYLGTNDMKKVRVRVDNDDKQALLVYKGMAYQVAKYIGEMSVVLKGDVDAIVITGGIAYDEQFINWIKEYIKHIAKVMVFPGEEEMEALAMGGLRVLRGEEKAKVYT